MSTEQSTSLDDPRETVADMVRRYFELFDQLDGLPDGRARKVAISGQLDRLADRIGSRVGPRIALVSGSRVMVPLAGVRPCSTTYRVFAGRDIDVESYLKYESDLVEVATRHIHGQAIEPEETRILASEVRIATGANADEADEVLDRMRELRPEDVPADVVTFKSVAAAILARSRRHPAFTLPGEDF